MESWFVSTPSQVLYILSFISLAVNAIGAGIVALRQRRRGPRFRRRPAAWRPPRGGAPAPTAAPRRPPPPAGRGGWRPDRPWPRRSGRRPRRHAGRNRPGRTPAAAPPDGRRPADRHARARRRTPGRETAQQQIAQIVAIEGTEEDQGRFVAHDAPGREKATSAPPDPGASPAGQRFPGRSGNSCVFVGTCCNTCQSVITPGGVLRKNTGQQ